MEVTSNFLFLRVLRALLFSALKCISSYDKKAHLRIQGVRKQL